MKNIELTVDEVYENLNDQLIGDFVTEDQDPTHTHTCTLVDDANGLFVVKNCQLYTAPNAGLNFEAKSECNVTVRSTDDGVPPLYREETFLVTVLDVNENPTLVIVSNLNVSYSSLASQNHSLNRMCRLLKIRRLTPESESLPLLIQIISVLLVLGKTTPVQLLVTLVDDLSSKTTLSW